ncbi:MAG: PilN domain-containing protein [Candidatus Omnitrophica bacterium]|nr:PilN domain-containing protein [Candidatus Omnitrophota bacterium]
MIRLNFIPENVRQKSGDLFEDGLGAIPREVIVGAMVAVLALLLVAHAVLGVAYLARSVEYGVLAGEWKSLQADQKTVVEVLDATKEAQAKLNALRPLMSESQVLWSQLINDVSGSVPKGVWLTQVALDKGVLGVYGNAVSQKKNEMLLVGNFVTTLKQKPSFIERVVSVDVDYSIHRRENSTLSVAEFTLKAKLK